MSWTAWILVIAAAAAITVAVSYVWEALRKAPGTPAILYWAPGIPIRYVDVDGMRLRHIETGQGPSLVLLHTLRTDLDIFQKVIPLLARRFTVHALDYPGHGFSDIPQEEYEPALFVRAVEGFLGQVNIRDATLAGISIGGVIPLLIAARHDRRVAKVISINPYDYARGLGIRRANAVARVLFTLAPIPLLGDTVMRMRNPLIEGLVMRGGVATPGALPAAFLSQLAAEGDRPGHYRAFLSLLRNAHGWEDAHRVYPQIEVPVLVVYGDRDWSRLEERRRTLAGIPGARLETIPNGGHFLSLDQPERLAAVVTEFALT